MKICIYCDREVVNRWGMGNTTGWVLAADEGDDDHCDKAGAAAHHAVPQTDVGVPYVVELAQEIFVRTSEKFPGVDQRVMQTLCVGEEAGEFVGATRRYLGMARRSGTFEEMEAELADVVISAHVAAEALGIDLLGAIGRKGQTILTRGWKQV